MKLLPPELQRELLLIIADALQTSIPNGRVFNAVAALQNLSDAPKQEPACSTST